MIIQFVLIIQTIIHGSYSQAPDSICSIDKPFEKADKTCGDFYEICLKKDDSICNNFQAACKQCPPTNYTVSMLTILKKQIDLSNEKCASVKGLIIYLTISSVIIFLAIFVIIILVLKRRKQNITLYNKEDGKLLEGKNIIYELKDEIYEMIKNQNEKLLKGNEIIDELRNKMNKMIQFQNEKLQSDTNKQYSVLESDVTYKVRFQIANQIDETELLVSKFDNVIKLKKSICNGNMNMKDYKRMIMKYKCVTLDNNQYLLSCIDSTNIYPIFCEFDDNVAVYAMIVIKLKCDNIYPEMLQIWKHQTIKQLKIIISELNKTNHEDLLISYKSVKLDDDDKTIDDYKIEENDWINVVNKSQETQSILMKSIFTDKETIPIEISKLETVASIINKSIEKVQQKMATNHFAVFLDNKLLENEKFIYEYNIDCKSLVEFCYLKSLNEIGDMIQLRDFGHIRLFKATNKRFNWPVLLRAYHKEYIEYMKDEYFSMILKEQLHMFRISKSHPRFIQLFGVYKDDDWIYVEMDNSTKFTMKNFLSNNIEIHPYEKSKWANQILEGLKHLHNHNIILKNMNPMDIWIDGNNDVKLQSFNLTEYLDHLNDEKYKYRYGVLIYVAPEILEGKPYEASVDVWSLGAVMIEIVTRGQLYPGLKEIEIVQQIKESHTIKYDKANKSADLIDFIDCCVKGDPKERSTIDQLMKHEFIEKYLLYGNCV